MDLTPYVDSIRRDLAVAAEAGGEDARALAERLTAPLESAVRLAMLDALSAAADDITLNLAPVSVEVRLRGRDPEFVVTPSPADRLFAEVADDTWSAALPPAPLPPDPPPVPDMEEGGTSRITLRIPERLKSRIERAANQEGLSVNSWLVRALSAALDAGDARPPAKGQEDSEGRREQRTGRRYTGWVR